MTQPPKQESELFLHEAQPIQTALGRYVLIIPTAAFVALDEVTGGIVDLLGAGRAMTRPAVIERLAPRFPPAAIERGIAELVSLEVIAPSGVAVDALREATPGTIGQHLRRPYEMFDPRRVPVTSLTAHVAHDCNLRCTYCYADTGSYGGGRTAMTCTMARRYVDFLLEHSGNAPQVTFIFFGGEPLMNFPTMVDAIDYGRRRAAETGKRIRFAMTTNGSLFDAEKIDYLIANDVAITVSMDGPPAAHDRFRIYADGRGSYQAIVERLQPLLAKAPVTCRITLTRHTTNVPELVDHFLRLGFYEVTIGSVGSPDPLMAIPDAELPRLLEGFRICAERYLWAVERQRYYGFGNLTNLLRLIHEGQARSFGCGAGIQTFAGDPDGDLYMCHRLVGQQGFKVGDVDSGIDEPARAGRLDAVHVKHKTACADCWARTLCAGSCFAHLDRAFGDTTRTYEPLCAWIRSWLDIGLRAYASIMERRPEFIERVIEPRLS